MWNSLKFKVLSTLLLSFLPTMFLVFMISYRTYDSGLAAEARDFTRLSDILEDRVNNIVRTASRAASGILLSPGWENLSREECQSRLQRILDRNAGYSSFVYVIDGVVKCNTGTGNVDEADFQNSIKTSLEIISQKQGDFINDQFFYTEISKNLYVVSSDKMDSPYGLIKNIMVFVDPRFVSDLLVRFLGGHTDFIALIDRNGVVITSIGSGSEGLSTLNMPSILSRINHADDKFQDVQGGYTYIAKRIINSDIWVVFGKGESESSRLSFKILKATLVAAVLIFVAAILATWIGLDRMVLRWIYHQRDLKMKYVGGASTLRIGVLPGAPREFQELAASFDLIAERMSERERSLETEIEHKKKYVKELHHRVKNNLQVIGSILSLMRRTVQPEQKEIVRFPEDRINAMSAVYRVGYSFSEMGGAPLKAVLSDVIQRLHASSALNKDLLSFEMHGKDIEVDIDTATSIAMLLAEILPSLFDSHFRQGQPLSLKVDVETSQLLIEVSDVFSESGPFEKLSQKFRQAYQKQLNAQIEKLASGGMRLVIPLPPCA